MQSYAVDEWEDRGRPARGDLHPARLRRPLAAGRRGRAPAAAAASYGNVASTGVHLSDTLRRAGRARAPTARCGSPTSSPARTPTGSRSASRAPPSSSTPPAPARSTRRSRASRSLAARPDRRARSLSPAAGAGCASRRFTRWAPRAWTPTPARGVAGADGAVHGAEALYVADGSLLPSSIGVNPMMTIIAMASRVARRQPSGSPEALEIGACAGRSSGRGSAPVQRRREPCAPSVVCGSGPASRSP